VLTLKYIYFHQTDIVDHYRQTIFYQSNIVAHKFVDQHVLFSLVWVIQFFNFVHQIFLDNFYFIFFEKEEKKNCPCIRKQTIHNSIMYMELAAPLLVIKKFSVIYTTTTKLVYYHTNDRWMVDFQMFHSFQKSVLSQRSTCSVT
jgi:hypothetical protein